MTEEKGSTPQSLSELGKNGGFGGLFFEGLPTMTGIVTIVAQPFAQDSMKKMFALPEWLPALIALAAAGLLALYRIRIVKKSGFAECAILCPILVFIIFSAYVGGNNVVYYAKEGVSRTGVESVSTGKAEEETLATQKKQIEILSAQLQNANEMIKKLSTALNLSQSEPVKGEHPSVSSLFRLPGLLGVERAYAQERESQPGEIREPSTPDTERLRELQEQLKRYEQTQQNVDKKLQDLQKEQQKPPQKQEAPLIKSW